MHPNQKVYLYKRNNGIYYIGTEIDGRRRWKSTGSKVKAEALRVISEFRKEKMIRNDNLRLGSLKSKVLEFVKEHYPFKTYESYKFPLEKLCEQLGDIQVAKINQYHIDRFKILHLKRVSPTTINVYLRTLRAAFNHAIRWNDIEENPFKGVEMVRIPERAPLYFKKEEVKKIMNVIKENWLKDAVLFTLLTGLRRGEMVNLRWDDVDLDSKLIFIESHASFRTKAGKRRAIPLNDEAMKVLRNRYPERECEYVFTHGGNQLNGEWVSEKFRSYVRKSGLNRKLHFHSLRHTFATWLVKAGVSIYEVQKLLGHSSVTVTQVYSHLASEELHSAVSRLHL